MDSFSVTRSLLNPKFEGYKLEIIEESDVLSRYSLPTSVTQSTANGLLSFAEMRARISHNHLSVSERNLAWYVDSEGKIVEINLKPDGLGFRTIYEMPASVSVDNKRHAEYPSILSIKDSNFLLASDGHGLLHVLNSAYSGGDQCMGIYTLSDESNGPFKLHSAVIVDGHISVVLSARFYHATKAKKEILFDLYGVIIPLSSEASDSITPLQIQWHRRGTDVPLAVEHSPAHDTFVVFGGSNYDSIDTPGTKEYVPSTEEMAPIPRAGENLDVDSPKPYSWIQSEDSLTVAFALPSKLPKSSIQIKMTSSTLSLRIASSHSQSEDFPWPNYETREWWDKVVSDESYWTWDSSDSPTTSLGLLTLHLTKSSSSPKKWQHVFASSALDPSQDVPETLDPSELHLIRESLAKFTKDISEDTLGLGKGVPSLAEGEMDDEVDADMGRQVWITLLPTTGTLPTTWPKARGNPVLVLSTSMPGWHEGNDPLTLIIREALDGPQFTLSPSQPPEWSHTATFPALSFVLASKLDARFTYHLSNHAVLLFESGIGGKSGNLYIYRGTTGKWGKQAIVKIGNGEISGALVGVGMLGRVLLCLYEKEVVVLRGIQW